MTSLTLAIAGNDLMLKHVLGIHGIPFIRCELYALPVRF